MNDNKKVERFVGTTRGIRFIMPTDFYWQRVKSDTRQRAKNERATTVMTSKRRPTASEERQQAKNDSKRRASEAQQQAKSEQTNDSKQRVR